MTDPISNERLVEMLAGLKGVTPGPWRMVTDYPSISIGAGDYRVVQTANQNNHRRFGTAERWIGIEHETNATHIARCDPDTIRSLIEEVQASRRQSPAGGEPGAWTMRINYGPDGEANYANVYSGTGEFVGNLKVHHAGAIVDASPPPKAVTITDEMVNEALSVWRDYEFSEPPVRDFSRMRAALTAALSNEAHNGRG